MQTPGHQDPKKQKINKNWHKNLYKFTYRNLPILDYYNAHMAKCLWVSSTPLVLGCALCVSAPLPRSTRPGTKFQLN